MKQSKNTVNHFLNHCQSPKDCVILPLQKMEMFMNMYQNECIAECSNHLSSHREMSRERANQTLAKMTNAV